MAWQLQNVALAGRGGLRLAARPNKATQALSLVALIETDSPSVLTGDRRVNS